MKNEQLLRKGHKKVDQIMRRRGYSLYDCLETEDGYEAEWYKSHAGVTLDTVVVVFNKNWRVIKVK